MASGPSTSSRRQKAEVRGRRAELLAAGWLMLKGYSIIARRAKTKVGEIDLVARKGRVLAFVEVKARSTVDECLLAVTLQSQRRIVRAAGLWAGARPWAQGLVHRFDVVAIVPRRRPQHVIDAFRPEQSIR